MSSLDHLLTDDIEEFGQYRDSVRQQQRKRNFGYREKWQMPYDTNVKISAKFACPKADRPLHVPYKSCKYLYLVTFKSITIFCLSCLAAMKFLLKST